MRLPLDGVEKLCYTELLKKIAHQGDFLFDSSL